MQHALQRARQRQATGSANHDLVGGELDVNVVRQRLDDHALRRGEHVEFDEILLVDEAACRPEAGHHQELIADLGIRQAMQPVWAIEGDADAGARRADQIARDIERVGRIDDRIADGQAPPALPPA